MKKENPEYKLEDMKEMEARGELVDMNMTDFIKRLETADFPEYKIISDMMKISLAEINMNYYAMKTEYLDKINTRDGWNETTSTEEFDKLLNVIAGMGQLLRECTNKMELCNAYRLKKLPDVFKIIPDLIDAEVEKVEDKED